VTPRNRNAGGVSEAMVVPALERSGYACEMRVKLGFGKTK
jgi:hypothetical protein